MILPSTKLVRKIVWRKLKNKYGTRVSSNGRYGSRSPRKSSKVNNPALVLGHGHMQHWAWSPPPKQ
ncbi:hypothetical protein Mapa_011343 [Marchantia paleacea]|nr:hypothetical protein Mapa_011343 [Marchantia paleacea]